MQATPPAIVRHSAPHPEAASCRLLHARLVECKPADKPDLGPGSSPTSNLEDDAAPHPGVHPTPSYQASPEQQWVYPIWLKNEAAQRTITQASQPSEWELGYLRGLKDAGVLLEHRDPVSTTTLLGSSFEGLNLFGAENVLIATCSFDGSRVRDCHPVAHWNS